MELTLQSHPSPIGTMLLLVDRGGSLWALDFEDHEARMHTLLRRQVGPVSLRAGTVPPHITQTLDDYFDGKLQALQALPTRTGGTPFQRSVWQALTGIQPGTTQSYGEVAQRLGRPTATRAVGLANGANPISLAIPCHRVIGSNGTLTGYGGGLWRKQWLLRHEQKEKPLQAELAGAS